MTSGQFWLILIFIGGGFWATIVLLEGSRKNPNKHHDLMHANAQDQLVVLREIGRVLADIRYTVDRLARPDALEDTLAQLQDLAGDRRLSP
jgi:hypothetical protein